MEGIMTQTGKDKQEWFALQEAVYMTPEVRWRIEKTLEVFQEMKAALEELIAERSEGGCHASLPATLGLDLAEAAIVKAKGTVREDKA